MTHLMIVVTAVLSVFIINETTCKAVISGGPSCMVRGGREFVVAFKRPTQIPSTAVGHNLYLEWSINKGVTERGSQPCWYYSSTDQIACLTTWSLFNKQIMESSVNVHVINKSTKKIIWRHPHSFKPYKHLFDCFTNINIRNLKLFESKKANKWHLSWRPLYWSKRFKPRFEVTVDNKLIDLINIQDCNHGNRRKCQIELSDDLRAKTDLEICVKSIFDLDEKNYYTTTTKTVKQCTVDSLQSGYRLKVINVKTGKEVDDYGLWHHPLGEKLNKTVLLEIENTKKNFNKVYNKTLEESLSKNR